MYALRDWLGGLHTSVSTTYPFFSFFVVVVLLKCLAVWFRLPDSIHVYFDHCISFEWNAEFWFLMITAHNRSKVIWQRLITNCQFAQLTGHCPGVLRLEYFIADNLSLQHISVGTLHADIMQAITGGFTDPIIYLVRAFVR